jgi:WD40 repeat protein
MIALVLLALAAGPPAPRVDALGDPLPDGAIARLGSARFLHEGVGATVMSPDGRFLATAGWDGIRVTTTATGALVRRIAYEGRAGIATRLTISPDGSRVVNLGVGYTPHGGSIAIYNVRTGKFEMMIQGHGPRHSHSFSRDGGRMAVLESDQKAAVWDLGRETRLCRVEAYAGTMSVVALSPDGKTLATCIDTERHLIRIWDVGTGLDMVSLDAEIGYFQEAVFSPDGRTLATLQKEGRLCLWDVTKKKRLAEIKLSLRDLVALRFSPDGKKLAVGAANGTVEFYAPRTGKRLSVGKGPPNVRLTGLGFRADGKAVALGACFSRAVLWDAGSEKRLWDDVGHMAPIHALAFRPNGDLVSGAADGCRIWRSGTWAVAHKAKRALPATGNAEGQRTFLSPDGRYGVWVGAAGTNLIDPANGKDLGRLCGPNTRWMYVFSPDGRQLVQVVPFAAGARKSLLQVWGLPGLRGSRDLEVSITNGGSGKPHQVAFSPDGSALAVTFCEHAVVPVPGRKWAVQRAANGMVFGLAKGAKQAEFLTSEHSGIAWSPDGRVLAVGNAYYRVSILRATDGKVLGAVSSRQGASLITFSPCGRLLAVASEFNKGQVIVYEMVTGTARFVLEGHSGPVLAMAFSHDGRLLATGGQDTTALLWDVGGSTGGRLDDSVAWAALADGKAERAFAVMSDLERRPATAVRLLRKHLKPAPGKALDDRAVKKAIEGLGDDNFETRESSQQALTAAAERLAPRLEKAMREAADLEVKERLRAVLTKATGWPRPELARTVRAVEVLERLGTAEARKFLRELSAGNAEARLTMEAKAALKRLERKP